MVEITDDLANRLYNKYNNIIRYKIINYKIINKKLVNDVVNEVFAIAFDEIQRMEETTYINYRFNNYWIISGINKVLTEYFDEGRLLKKNEIQDFSEKVMYLVSEKGYSEEEAKKYVIMDESLRKGYLTKLFDRQ